MKKWYWINRCSRFKSCIFCIDGNVFFNQYFTSFRGILLSYTLCWLRTHRKKFQINSFDVTLLLSGRQNYNNKNNMLMLWFRTKCLQYTFDHTWVIYINTYILFYIYNNFTNHSLVRGYHEQNSGIGWYTCLFLNREYM